MLLTAYPRLHLALIDCGYATPRAYGGIGVSLAGPSTKLSASRFQHFEILEDSALDEPARCDLSAAIERFASIQPLPNIRIRILSQPPAHVGLGSRTSLLLGTLALLARATERTMLPYELQKLSGRGGASGIGIHAFFQGGFLFDGGHERRVSPRFVPSSAQAPKEPPPLVLRIPCPSTWCFDLVMPTGFRRSGPDEVSFFESQMPIPELEILQTLALIYHGLAPGFLRVDLRVAADALRRLQRVGFKRREIDGQTDSVRQCLGYLLDRTQAPVGMSSMGPLLYVLRDVNDRDTAKAISEVTELTGAAFLGTYPGQNEPYVISGSLDDDR